MMFGTYCRRYRLNNARSRQTSETGAPSKKSYWAQWKSLAVRGSMLERHWESADGKTKTAQAVIPHSKENDVLSECTQDLLEYTLESTRHSTRTDSDTIGCI
jgi:hypothetical protein